MPTKPINYKSTIFACYAGNLTQSIVVNVTPIIFIPLREMFGFSYSQFGFLVLLNFFTQVITDVLFSKAVDKYGFRRFILSADILCVFGFVLFGLTPQLFAGNEFIGFSIATIIFSSAGGLLELLLSPIIDAIPVDEENASAKHKAMALLHSVYSWGQVLVVIVTTVMIFFKIDFSIILFVWAVIPFVNIFMFLKVPLPQKVSADKIMKIRNLIKNPVFILAFFAILFGGAAEVTISQWSSSFMQKGLGLPKIVGDMLGMCGFALMMGIGRMTYGLLGQRLNLKNILIGGSFFSIICYVVLALSPFKWLSIVACVVSGLCVSLLWPGTLTIAAEKLPLAGASMFALLAAGGDIGASVGPYFTGIVTDAAMKYSTFPIANVEQMALKIALLVATIIPIVSFILQMKFCKIRD